MVTPPTRLSTPSLPRLPSLSISPRATQFFLSSPCASSHSIRLLHYGPHTTPPPEGRDYPADRRRQRLRPRPAAADLRCYGHPPFPARSSVPIPPVEACPADSYPIHAVKSGYPPQPLTLIPELPLASLGLKGGDQLTLTQKAGASSAPFQTPSPPRATVPPPAATSRAPQAAPPSIGATHSQGPDSVPLEGGYLVHRVRLCPVEAR